MNKNFTALILVVLGIGIYFTFTQAKLKEIKEIRVVNAQYSEAIDNSAKLIKVRDGVLANYNQISEEDKKKLNKLIPDNVDNVRLIIDLKDSIAARHGLSLKNIKTSSPENQPQSSKTVNTKADDAANGSGDSAKYGTVTVSFSVTSSYDTFLAFLRELEGSLRIMDISKLTVTVAEGGSYDFSIELKTYWLKQ
jgi:Tfp pilus assembly protein PilO